jgi:hypothetical protein
MTGATAGKRGELCGMLLRQGRTVLSERVSGLGVGV